MRKAKRVNGRLILGDGEVTGHQHTVSEPGVTMFYLDVDGGAMVMNIPTVATLRHEKSGIPAEHRDISLPRGEPVVTTKRRWEADGWSDVED